MARLLAWLGGVLLVVTILVIGAAWVLAQTQPGHDFLLRAALQQLGRHVDGEVEVGVLRSDGLLRGFTLHDVRIQDSEGRPFLEADSLLVRYAARGLLRREIVLAPAEIWSPRITIEATHEDPRWNVARIFLPSRDGGNESDDAGSGITLLLRDTRIHDAEVLIRRPVEWDGGATRSLIEPASEEGAAYHTMRFADVNATLATADLMGAGMEGERLRVEDLSFTGHVVDTPFRVEAFRGDMERVGSRLSVRADELRLPGSRLHGSVAVDWSGGLEIDADVSAQALDFADIQWIDPRIPQGSGRLDIRMAGPLDRARVRIGSADLRTDRSRVVGDIGFELGETFRLLESDVELLPFQLSELDVWLSEPLPVQGLLRGDLAAQGPLEALQLRGDVRFEDPEGSLPSSTVRTDGTVHVREDLAVTDLDFTLDPFDYGTLRAFSPGLELRGEGRAEGRVSGSLASGLAVVAQLEHRVDGLAGSSLGVAGSLRTGSDDVHLALDVMLEPLSLDGMEAGIGRELPLLGLVSGPVRAEGTLSDLALSGRLDTPAGLLDAGIRLNVRDPASGYRAEGSVEAFRLHELVAAVPEPTVLTGDFIVDGRGGEPETLRGNASVDVRDSSVAGLDLDLLAARLRAEGGRLFVEDLELQAPLGRLSGEGDLALRDGQPHGEMLVTWEVASLAELGPMLAPSDSVAVEPVVPFDPDFFRMNGVEEEVVPTANGGQPAGSGRGELRFRGALSDLSVDGFVELEQAAYGGGSLDRGRADVVGHWAGREEWEIEGAVDLDGFTAQRYEFRSGSGELAYRPGSGTFRVDAHREGMETYRASGTFVHDSTSVDVGLEAFSLDLDGVAWTLSDPTRIRVTESSVQVDALHVVRPLGDGVEGDTRFEIGGRLDLQGDSDLEVTLTGVDLDRVGRIIQTERLPAGALDLSVDIEGPAEAPRIAGSLAIRGFAFNGASLSLVEGTVAYDNRLLRASLHGDLEDRTRLAADGQFPMDLSFREVADRFPERAVDVTLRVDALPAQTALGFLEQLEDLEGTLDGELNLLGTPDELEPSGVLRLRDGAVHLPGLGLRPTAIAADLRLREDRTVEVLAEARARGAAQISGTVSLDELSDPVFDLEVVTNGFQAVERRDLTARVGGTVRLGGAYTAPQVSGRVRVEQGELYLDEVARTAGVVDLSDPAFFDVVDTTLVTGGPTLQAAQNPFMQNLAVDVDLEFQRDFWLRSGEMNAEIGGELAVDFERRVGEMVLVGTLQPTRGSYTAFGRQFQVQSGTVEFPGTPGINPALNIQAVHRLRRERDEPLNVVAHVEGTLTNPTVRLTTDAQPPIAQSDLVSYLLFGRPSYALAAGETSVLQGAQGAAVTMGIGTVATQLGSVVARQFGVDYFTITQSRDAEGLGGNPGISGFAETQIEVGQYIGNNLFLSLILRPLTGLGATTQHQVPGARLEWRFADTWSMEGFAEDRFARDGSSRFGPAGVSLSRVFGLSVFREWGF